jgi:hypothetical protein
VIDELLEDDDGLLEELELKELELDIILALEMVWKVILTANPRFE